MFKQKKDIAMKPTSNKIFFYAFLVFIIFTIFILFALKEWLYLNFFSYVEFTQPKHYCRTIARELSDDEVILIALNKKYSSEMIQIEHDTKTATDFYKKYPNCCSVERFDISHPRNFKSWLNGKDYIEVQGYSRVYLFYPLSEKGLNLRINLECTKSSKNINKCIKQIKNEPDLRFSYDRQDVSDCGKPIDGQSLEFLNLRETPFYEVLVQ